MSHLLDVNVLVALAWPNHVHHTAARAWFAGNHSDGWATCSTTESGFIRVASNRRVNPEARPPAEAALLLQRLCAISGHAYLDDTVQFSQHADELQRWVHSSSQVTDAHLLLLARHHSIGLVTFDRGIAAMAAGLGVTVSELSM